MKTHLLLPVFLIACADPPAEPADASEPTCVQGIGPGECAPDFTLQDQTGTEVSLSSYQDRVVVLSLFTGW